MTRCARLETGLTFLLITLLPIWAYLVIEGYIARRRDLVLRDDAPAFLPENPPLVSVLVPARNEEANIGRCLDSLLNQEYPNFEVIVISDRSTDRTTEIVKEYGKDPRVKLLEVTELPEGWTGKNHALHRGVQEAKGEWLLFVDADTRLSRRCIVQTMAHALDQDVDMVSLLGKMEHRTFWEKMLVPPLGVTLMLWYPPKLINKRGGRVGFANGQFMLIKRETYEACGGHAGVRGELLEDIAMGKKMKRMGGHVNLALAPTLYTARMYRDLWALLRGWSRILHSGLHKNAWLIALHIAATLYISILPLAAFAWGVWGVFAGRAGSWPVVILSVLVWGLMVWAVGGTYWVSDSDRRYAVLHPVSCIVIVGILFHSLYTAVAGRGIVWRGTVYPSK